MRRKQNIHIVFVDCSRSYYEGIAKTMPEKRTGKFVQIRHRDTEYLVSSVQELARYHADIVERFCSGRDIAGSYNKESKRFDIFEPDWAVIGGGRFEIDEKKRCIRLYDNSMAYGRFDAKELKEKILSIDEFSNYTVTIK